jgi:hypothetical protein
MEDYVNWSFSPFNNLTLRRFLKNLGAFPSLRIGNRALRGFRPSNPLRNGIPRGEHYPSVDTETNFHGPKLETIMGPNLEPQSGFTIRLCKVDLHSTCA